MGNKEGVLLARPHDTDTALADGGGYRRDGILIHSLILVDDTSFARASKKRGPNVVRALRSGPSSLRWFTGFRMRLRRGFCLTLYAHLSSWPGPGGLRYELQVSGK